MTLRLDPRIIFRVLLLLAALLLCGHAFVKVAEYSFGHARLLGLSNLLDLNEESNFGAWFSWSLLLGTALALAVTAVLDRTGTGHRHRYWWSLAIIFTFLSLDEAVSLHEQLDNLRGPGEMSGILFFPWVIAGSIFVLIVAGAHLKFVLGLPPRVRSRMLVGGVLFVVGAIGLEVAQGFVWEAANGETAMVATLVGIEEFLEMFGVILFLDGVLQYIRDTMKIVEIRAGA